MNVQMINYHYDALTKAEALRTSCENQWNKILAHVKNIVESNAGITGRPGAVSFRGYLVPDRIGPITFNGSHFKVETLKVTEPDGEYVPDPGGPIVVPAVYLDMSPMGVTASIRRHHDQHQEIAAQSLKKQAAADAERLNTPEWQAYQKLKAQFEV